MKRNEIIEYLNKGLRELEKEPGKDKWSKGWDAGWQTLAINVIDMLSDED